jgi:hypothetical protein
MYPVFGMENLPDITPFLSKWLNRNLLIFAMEE